MAYDGFACLRVHVDGGVAFVTIDHPPINLLDRALIVDLDRLGRELAADAAVRAVVLASADPEFFVAHADVQLILEMPAEAGKPTALGFFHAMVDRFRTMPKVTIAQIEGRARGGGSELALSCDLRFGAIGRAIVAQPEVALGIIPGGSGTQRLARLMGRARAVEAILGCEDFPADLAERYGWLNRALAPDEIGPFVEALARRIASFPAEAVALAKEAIDAAEGSTVDGLLAEAHAFNRALATPVARNRMERFLALGGQTRETELNLQRLIEKLPG